MSAAPPPHRAVRSPLRVARRPSGLLAAFAAAVAAGCVLLISAARPAAGQEPIATERPRVLVLSDGEVYGGLVTEYSYGVKVRSARGSVVLSADRVRVNARSLDDAYQQLRADLAPRDASGHAKLAAWCLTNGLPLRSREELLTALTLEPGRDDWSRALRRVETRIARSGLGAAMAGVTAAGGTPPATGGVRAASHFELRREPPRTASAAGLTAESVRQFSARTERILLMRCGNAGCHGGPDAGTFRLTNPSRSAATTRANLAATLAFVGDGGGLSSPLLTVCTDRPDRRGRTPFRVQGGPASRAALAAWVARVAAERPDLAGPAPAGPTHADRVGGEGSAESRGAAPPARPIRPDAFDPAEFNRTFAPAPTDPAAANAAAATPPPTAPSADLPE